MNTVACLLLAWLTLLPLIGAQAPENRVMLFSHTRRSGITFEWWLSQSRAALLPRWNPDEGDEPPLSLTKAIATAQKEGEKSEKLESVAIVSIPGAEYALPFDKVFYYKVTFKVGSFDRRVCVVLMDGSLLRPVVASSSKSIER